MILTPAEIDHTYRVIYHIATPPSDHTIATRCGLPYGLPADNNCHREATAENPVNCPGCLADLPVEDVAP